MISDAVYYHYLSALLEGNKSECVKIVSDLLERNEDPKEIYIKLFQRSMYRIGYLWEHNRTSVAREHIASKITESLLTLLYPKIMEIEKIGKKVVISCIDKEFHEIGPKIVSDFFELNGWESIFLGSNTPQNEIIDTIKETEPDLLGISNNFYINVVRLLKLIDQVRDQFPNLQIIVGGQALAEGHDDTLKDYKGVHYIPSLYELENFIKSVNGVPS